MRLVRLVRLVKLVKMVRLFSQTRETGVTAGRLDIGKDKHKINLECLA